MLFGSVIVRLRHFSDDLWHVAVHSAPVGTELVLLSWNVVQYHSMPRGSYVQLKFRRLRQLHMGRIASQSRGIRLISKNP